MPDNSESSSKRVAPLQPLDSGNSGVLRPLDNVETAGTRMREHAAEKWPVVEDTKLVGMVDEGNPDWQAAGHGHDPKDEKVGTIMSRSTVFCFEDEDRAHAEALMKKHGLSHLPVLDRQMRVVGIFKGAAQPAGSSGIAELTQPAS